MRASVETSVLGHSDGSGYRRKMNGAGTREALGRSLRAAEAMGQETGGGLSRADSGGTRP